MDSYPLLYTLQTPALSLATWEAYDPSVKVHLTSTALRIGDQLFLFDPIPLPEGTDLTSGGVIPTAILLTSGNHERAALDFAERWEIPVHAAAEAIPEFSDALRKRVTPLPNRHVPLEVISLPGGAEGETAFFTPEGGGVVIVGDALINLPETGFCLLPEKYCLDVVELRESVRQLSRQKPSVIAFAHGRPLTGTEREGIAEKIAALPEEG